MPKPPSSLLFLSPPASRRHRSIYVAWSSSEVWLKTFPDVTTLANLDLVDSPLIVSPDDLAEVVQALARQRESIKVVLDDPPHPAGLATSKGMPPSI